MEKKWIDLSQKYGEDKSFVDILLEERGIKDKERFLNIGVKDLHDTLLLDDAKEALDILKESIKKEELIIVYTDYDTDGACGGATAFLMLRELGANVSLFSNNRFDLGYGICKKGIDQVLEKNKDTKVILTVDNGISAIEAVSYAKEKGLKVIVTDHHEPGSILPEADAIVNPKRKGSIYPFAELCGAGVVWKLLRELYKNKKKANAYLDIVAIATVGDIVPLIDENRIIVKEGLKLLNEEKRLSLKILKEESKTTEITSNTLGFSYSPIFNASGRLNGDVLPVIRMICSESEGYIRATCKVLVETNEKRKDATKEQYEICLNSLENPEEKEAIVFYKEGLDEGIVGLIAGKIKEKYNKPTFILTDSSTKGEIKGSARSINGFNLKEVLDLSSDILLSYGGHYMAAGLSLEKENLKILEESIISECKKRLTREDYIKKYHFLRSLKEDEVNGGLIKTLRKLEPYGEGFEKPLLMINDFDVKKMYCMGKNKEHLKLHGDYISIIGFSQAEDYANKGYPAKIKALGYPEFNVFNNNVSIQFLLAGSNMEKA